MPDKMINLDRIVKVATPLKTLGIDFTRRVEQSDPQFAAVARIGDMLGLAASCVVSVFNSVVCYRLTGRGEEYWLELMTDVEKHSDEYRSPDSILRALTRFLRESKHNRFLIEQKLGRLFKLASRNVHKIIYEKAEYFANNLELLRRLVAAGLGTRPDSKTVVFSVKMFYYAYTACTGMKLLIPGTIPLPADRRIAALAYTSGIVTISAETGNLIESLLRRPKLITDAWSRVASHASIPPLHLDAPLWAVGRHLRQGEGAAYRALLNMAGEVDHASLREFIKQVFIRKI